jgi:site-specific DNA-methyltransferase (adenine-specific)
MCVRIEDAGFEIRDMIAWVYGTGFPKSRNLKDGQWAGWGTALKPALEPITLARKPFGGTVAGNVLEYGCGALNVDGCRVDGDPWIRTTGHRQDTRGGKFHAGAGCQRIEIPPQAMQHAGRWPANLIHDGSDEVLGLFPDSKSSGGVNTRGHAGESRMGRTSGQGANAGGLGDAGSAARFFYCPKASKRDRDAGLDAERNTHPTVKPTELMRYLCRLVTQPGGLVLDPFMGSGSTGKAAMLEGFDFIGIDREAEYVALARARIASARGLL